jgi:selenocysteine lyase/cysteine desulfurase
VAKEYTEIELKADLQTAQNRMFSFVGKALSRWEQDDYVTALLENPSQLKAQYDRVRQLLFDLLNIPKQKRDFWHMGIADSGKRTIGLLVNYLCSAQSGKNAIVDTENYVGFNKFSAAKVLEKQKGVVFETPFNVELGRALTVNAEAEFGKMKQLFEDNCLDTLWLSWNSTSTGVRENIEQIVECRNAAKSRTLIIADAASVRLFSNQWKDVEADHLPDAFFFSLRKQGLPYDGPNDEFHQAQNSGSLIIFNDIALKLSEKVGTEPIYDSPTLAQYMDGRMTSGEQRTNHVKHLLKLSCACEYFLSNGKKHLIALDDARNATHLKIKKALCANGGGSPEQFSLFSDPDAQSDSAYILKVPANTSAKTVIAGLKESGILISACMHPKMDVQKYVRFAFYPGNSTDEVDYLLDQIKGMA